MADDRVANAACLPEVDVTLKIVGSIISTLSPIHLFVVIVFTYSRRSR